VRPPARPGCVGRIRLARWAQSRSPAAPLGLPYSTRPTALCSHRLPRLPPLVGVKPVYCVEGRARSCGAQTPWAVEKNPDRAAIRRTGAVHLVRRQRQKKPPRDVLCASRRRPCPVVGDLSAQVAEVWDDPRARRDQPAHARRAHALLTLCSRCSVPRSPARGGGGPARAREVGFYPIWRQPG